MIQKFNEYNPLNEGMVPLEIEGVTVYDNGGSSPDRYTVVLNDVVYAMSYNPSAPNGICHYMGHTEDLQLSEGDELITRVPDAVKAKIEELLTGEAVTESKKEGKTLTEDEKNLIEKLGKTPEIYALIRKVSPSGMSRNITFLISRDGKIIDISFEIGKILGYTMDKGNFSLKVNGAGMDMCFHVVYTLSDKLYGDGYKIKKQQL